MVLLEYGPKFAKKMEKVKDKLLQIKIQKQIDKVIENPEIGKPMRFMRKGTRELHIAPYRLAYGYFKEENKVFFIDLYHKDEQ